MITLQNNGIRESQMEHLKAEERLNNHISVLQQLSTSLEFFNDENISKTIIYFAIYLNNM